MNEQLTKKTKEIIEKILYITIATVSEDGQPWNSPVYSAFDENYNFYWNSWKENQHSKNIAENGKVFIVIYDSTLPEGSGANIGVYIQAKAYALTDEKEIERARKLLAERKTKKSSKVRSAREFMGDYPRRVYKAVPEKVWMNDVGEVKGNYVDKRVEVKL
ncbi:MAG: pyridoxamine 5'-phosphate oxidase family protein [Patescibacteria group bacterium]